MLHACVMAGGSGTRFWPESRAARPKQLLPLGGEQTMLRATVDRLAGLVPDERVVVVTGAGLVDAVRGELAELPADSIVGEPCRRDTAPCIGLAALLMLRRDPRATMLVMPSDHVIAPREAFQRALSQAAALVEEEPARIVTFGIRPSYPAESFGYIERGEPLSGAVPAFRVRRFREKPKADVAREYVESGSFYWNSGIFVWRAATIAAELARHEPEMHAHLVAIVDDWGTPRQQATFEREFGAIRPRSIDYAVMEKAEQVVVIEAPFAWDDVGSWQAVARLRGADAEGNTVIAKHLGIQTKGTIVRAADDLLIVTLGVDDLLVVHTADATLVARKADEESIRLVVKELENRGWREYL